MSKIPVFVSCPTNLNSEQDLKREVILKVLEELNLEPRSLGRSDYTKNCPLKEVYVIAKHCSGGMILGFEQIIVQKGVKNRGIEKKEKIINGKSNFLIPTPWNQLEAGLLYGPKLPLLIFKEEGIEGGIFDTGISDVYIHNMPPSYPSAQKSEEIKQVIQQWYAEVIKNYQDC